MDNIASKPNFGFVSVFSMWGIMKEELALVAVIHEMNVP
jgi:hypothetical protein